MGICAMGWSEHAGAELGLVEEMEFEYTRRENGVSKILKELGRKVARWGMQVSDEVALLELKSVCTGRLQHRENNKC